MAKFINPPQISGDRYLVDTKDGRILTIEDMKTKGVNIGIIPIPIKYIDNLIDNGYITHWDIVRQKWREGTLGKDFETKSETNESTYNKEAKTEMPKEEPKQKTGWEDDDPLIWDFFKKDYSKNTQSQSYQDQRRQTYEETRRQQTSNSQSRKERPNMSYEGQHTAGRMNRETADRIYENAKQTSFTGRKHAAQRNPEAKEEVKKEKHFNWKKFICGVLITATISGATIGITNKIDTMVTNYQVNQTGQNIGTLLVPEGSKNTPSILDRHTERTNDYQGFWYDNQAIAEDLLKLPDSMFPAALGQLRIEMGEYSDTGYVNNIERVIVAVAEACANENLSTEEIRAFIEAHPNAFALCGGCDTYEKFLIKNGFINEKGEPSEEAFIEFSKQIIKKDYKTIKTAADEYDPNWVANANAEQAESLNPDIVEEEWSR